MSIKKLFDSNGTSRNYLADSNEKEAFQEIESVDNLRALKKKQDTYVPHVDYSDPKNFAKFGSGYLYYKSAVERIIDFYPYDGSDAELNEFYDKSLDIEKYIFSNMYPRTHGFIKLSANRDSTTAGWGTLSGTLQSGYGLPSSLEYIDFKGGPHTTYSGSLTDTPDLFKDPYSSKHESSNIYDTSIYTSAGLPSDYGSGTRQSNLRANFDTGVTIEFWAKTGSLNTALTNKQVMVDLWNNELTSSTYDGDASNANPHYGRITIAFNGLSAGTPFLITAQSGTATTPGIFEQTIGNSLKVNTFDNWKHYAFVMQNTGSDFVTRLYVNGQINDINYTAGVNINEINSKNMVGRLGSLLTAPSGAVVSTTTPAGKVQSMVGSGKLSGSIDEFRYWKVARSGKDIGKNWFTQVRGGTNTDIANTTLGVYYKFNEGKTDVAATDAKVLDYSGRLSNGTWKNYTANGRYTGSAILEATASISEYKDPIIYSTNPKVAALKTGLLKSGSYHDSTNNGAFINLIPNWVIEEVEENETNNVRVISHIMGTYFDKIHTWITQLPTFKSPIYTSSSYTPLPFAQHLPQSLGLYTPDIFVDADVLESFMNRNEYKKFEGDLTETKNLIYLNLYNNLANIYKAKGTEKSIRNVFRCFNIDEDLIRLNVYSHNNTYTLKNNLQHINVIDNTVNFNTKTNLTGVVYQATSGSVLAPTCTYTQVATDPSDMEGYTVILPAFGPLQSAHTLTFDNSSGVPTSTTVYIGGYTTAAEIAGALSLSINLAKTANSTHISATDDGAVVTLTAAAPFDTRDIPIATVAGTAFDAAADATITAFAGYPETGGCISGSGPLGYEDKYGFTVESDIIFPRFFREQDKINRYFMTASLFGMHSASVDYSLINDTTVYDSNDSTNFQVYAVRDAPHSKNIYFKLSSSIEPFPFPPLTSSVFFNVYDQDRWNISVRLKPSNYPLTDVVSGSMNGPAGSGLDGYTYDLIFRGVNTELGNVNNSFSLTSSISQTVGKNFLRAAKRIYAGARKTNITGALINESDVLFSGIRYWSKYLEDTALDQHIFDISNRGISSSYENISPLDSNLGSYDIINLDTLLLDWSFDDVTGSNVNGIFSVTDFSSGSYARQLQTDYGWYGGWSGRQHTGQGKGFPTSSTDVIGKELVNSFKFIDPEMVVSSDMVQILSEDDKVFDVTETVPSYRYTLEKSMYNAISEEMLQFFAGVIDFNNVIGEPVNRYRHRYKALEKLRQIFFERVTKTSNVEKFIEYYKWFDDSLSLIIAQMLPASSDFSPDTYNIIESHVLERNKYQSKFPTLGFVRADMYGNTYGYGESTWTWDQSSPEESSPRNTTIHRPFWQRIADCNSVEITSGKAIVDRQRNNIKKVIFSTPSLSQSYPIVTTTNGTLYSSQTLTMDQLGKTSNFSTTYTTNSYIRGGTNFTDNKNLQFTYNALYPLGPVKTTGSTYIPLNVLVGFTEDMTKFNEATNFQDVNKKFKRYFKVNHGRDWEDGYGYSNVKSSYVFPFNIITPAVSSGFNKLVIDRVTSSIQITNLHHDSYGPDMEIPMQGPYTDAVVGGHQSRHVALNKSSSTNTYYVNGLDSYLSRPEAWKILLGTCGGAQTGAIGMAGPDYPWPEANAEGVRPYPMTGAQKATYYRNFVSKSPYNIRNILQSTGSALGNFSQNYQVIHSVGAYSNPRHFIDNQPTLPIQITETPSASQGRLFTDIHRTADGHVELIPSYSVGYLTGTNNKSIITGRFANPGGIETMGVGYKDIRAAEYSVYNVCTYRNLTVLKPSQGPSGTISQPTGSGTPGIRVYDIMGKDYGLISHLARHTAKFGRDPIFCLLPGKTYNQLPNFHKVHRNTKHRLVRTERYGPATSASLYDNFYVQYQIPRSDKQYAWMTGSIVNPTNERYMGFSPLFGTFASYYSTSAGYVSFFDFVSASEIGNSLPNLYQPTTGRLNIFTLDPVTSGTTNLIGYAADTNTASYYNNTLLQNIPTAVSSAVVTQKANYFNLLMTRRGNTFGWNWNACHQTANPILRAERKANEITLTQENRTLYRYPLSPVSMRGRTALVNMDAPKSPYSKTKKSSNNFTLRVSHNNEKIYFNDTTMDDFVLETTHQEVTTPLDNLLSVTAKPMYHVNWVVYRENLFPSLRNEFNSSSTERLDYNNKYWRDNLPARVTLGATIPNSFNLDTDLSQSSWNLDAQEDFQTRTGPVTGSIPAEYAFSVQGKAGELQNNYFSYFTGTLGILAQPIRYRAPRMLRFGALYSKKHMITTLRSPVSPGTTPIINYDVDASNFSGAIAPYSGEAKWEADSLAGIILKSGKKSIFVASASQPWFNEYDEYKQDLKLIAKDYSIVPEFRISEHIEDYIKYGLSNKDKTDTFEIVGTDINSSTGSFYRDYSNSEFMSEFLNIKNDTNLSGSEIRLICSAAIRLNPYKGFYPAQRTQDLVSQFSRSYGDSLFGTALKTSTDVGLFGFANMLQPGQPAGAMRPLFQPLFAPGVMYNSIKSGIAVDYPIVTDPTKRLQGTNYYGTDIGNQTDNWAITSTNSSSLVIGQGYNGGEYWDKRIPFEAIMEPETHLEGTSIFDIEPHPSMSLFVTSSWDGAGDEVYTLMAKNFFGEVANFFLADQTFTRLEGEAITDGIKFKSGSLYGARLKLRRSTTDRNYEYESGSSGDNNAYGKTGGRLYGGTGGAADFQFGAFPLPQDPRQNPFFKETFTMYSRPTAFGPAVGGRPTGSLAGYVPASDPRSHVLKASPVDSFNGMNWAYTPPYYNGESWVDFVFKPEAGTSYDLDTILSEIKTFYRRTDPGYDGMTLGPYGDNQTALISSFVTFSGSLQTIYGGNNVNSNAMQLSSSVNIFGIESVFEERTDKFGQTVENINKAVAKKWVIQPKWETPMLNFNSEGTRPISASANTLTLPSNYGSGSVPRGMWHQFGIADPDPQKGVFLEMGDIPVNWLKFHYDVLNNDTYYNDFDASTKGKRVYKKMESLLDVVGFTKKNSRVRLGTVADKKTIKEAIVAVPYIIESVDNTLANAAGDEKNMSKKKFFDIPAQRYTAALASAQGSAVGDSLDTAGESIRKLIQKMENYILPPQFDFLNNSDVDPLVMYLFEFEYSFDKDDLIYIWQNLAPRDYQKITFKSESIAHELADNELMNEDNIMDNENLRWMVFKVKQRSQINYDDMTVSQISNLRSQKGDNSTTVNGYPVGFNWPYDYVSFVEMIKFDVEVLYHNEDDDDDPVGPRNRKKGGGGMGGSY